MVEEKSKTSGRGIVVSRFNRRIVFASEVRAEADNSSHLLAVPLMGIFAIQRRPIAKVNGKSTWYDPYRGLPTEGFALVV